jgi:monoamine oxidase
MRMSYRSPLTAMFREAQAACREAAAGGAPIDEVTAARAARAPTRRQVPSRRQVLAGAGAATVATIVPRRSFAIGQPRVVIVGGGIAGLRCAQILWERRKIKAQIFEWDDRVGGRIQTLRNYFANSQITEQHAEFISTEHRATLRLAQDFGLGLENTNAYAPGTNDTYWFAGARYTQAQLNADWQTFGYELFRDAVDRAPGASYLHYSQSAYEWDHMSVSEWVDKYVPGGLAGAFGKMCIADVISEYGGPPEKQSALNLLYILGYDTSTASSYQPHKVPVVAGTDEKWHIRGGNDQLISGIAARLPEGTIALGRQLIALRENADGAYTCTFANGAGTAEAIADHVVLAIPFTTLRNVDLSRVTFSALKRTSIETLPLGNNAKIQIQVAGRPWVNDGYTGNLLTDTAPDGGWDGSSYQVSAQAGDTEIYIAFPGGAQGRSLATKYGMAFGAYQGPAPSQMVADTLAGLEPSFPGIATAWHAGPKLAWVNDGNIDPKLLGAWSQYNVGQYTGFSGIEATRQGNIHFAGEQTSPEYQGFIEGAVRSGERAAGEI